VNTKTFVPALVICFLTAPPHAAGEKRDSAGPAGPAVFWHDPRDIAARDLFYGPGGRLHEPHGPFTFLKEDLDGTNPKFVVSDRDGVKWKVKLGVEARLETVASRLVWAVGYYANEDYFLADLRVENLPRHLHRGQDLVAPDGSLHDVRLKREDTKKVAQWKWREDPFAGTREWNGLRVLMALLNNWDVKDENNAVYQNGKSEQIYMVSDLGASFGTDNLCWPHSKAKGNLKSYRRSKFIRRTNSTTVDFYAPAFPQLLYLVHPVDFFEHLSVRQRCNRPA